LDCPLVNLLKIGLRKKACLGEGKNQIIGTSIASTIALVSVFNSN